MVKFFTKQRTFFPLYVCLCIAGTGIFACTAEAHFFKLYAGTNEELKERVVVRYTPGQQVIVEYSGEYHGQLAPHIRFMMDENQDQDISPEEMQRFVEDYQKEWGQASGQKLLNLDNHGVRLSVIACSFPEVQQSNLTDPITVTMQFAGEPFHQNSLRPTELHLLEIGQELLFAFGRQFMLMAKQRAAFTDEQESEIVRFCQVSIRAPETVEFTRCYPGYVGRKKNEIEGIFYEDSPTRMQFVPIPKISATFTIHKRSTEELQE
jgi:hypothetical protein